ncbi:hypothetical protein, partial [Mesorhizobium japonicum]|uniref:hypothetical protein n=1 Tax=Mesorhizobium japonicum TaxID=2066070 RepID=UPI003B5BD212
GAGGVPVGCVVAYSSYAPAAGSAPPSGSLAANLDPGHQIACVDPAALLQGVPSGQATALDPVLPTRTLVQGNALVPNGHLALLLVGVTLPTDPTGYREQPDALAGRCVFSGDATANDSWLDIDDQAGILPDTSGSALGLHVMDYNVALGDLRTLLAAQAAAWLRTQEGPTR